MAGEHILIIDDKIEIITFLTDLLEPFGYTLSTELSGEAGLAKALQESPDLILLDVNMPGLSGLEVLEELHRSDCRVPVILMTLYGSENVAVRAFRLGVRNYISKPFDINEFLTAIEWALEEGRLRRERERLTAELNLTNQTLRRRMRELTTLQAIGRSVATLMSKDKLLRRILDATVYLTNADGGAVFLLEQPEGELHLEAVLQANAYHSGLQARPQDSHAEDVLRSGQVLWISDPTRCTGVTGYLGEQAHSLLYVPIKLGDQVVGVVGISYFRTKQAPPSEIQKRLTALADYAAIALKNAQLYEDSQRRVQQLATINHIAQLIAASLDLKEIMRTVVRTIKESLCTETATLVLLDEGSDDLVFEIVLRNDENKPDTFRMAKGQGIVGWVIQHGQSMRVNDVSQEPRFYSGIDQITGFCTHSILCVPLTVANRVIGAIEAINKLDDRMSEGWGQFTDEDECLLHGTAAFVAIAVENARLHKGMRETAAIEAIQQTMVTLSHYMNNSLQALLGASKLLRTEMGDNRINAEVARVIGQEVQKSTAVLSVLRDIASPESAVYLGSTQMLDVEQELQARLASMN